MNFELLGRIHKELSITGHSFYETVLAISEQVNRKVHIMRLHWQASVFLQRIDGVNAMIGQSIAQQVSRRFQDSSQPQTAISRLEETFAEAIPRIQEFKQSLSRVDTHIREIKFESIREGLLSLQRDLTLRSAGIERLTVRRGAPAASQSLSALPHVPDSRVVTILRGPFLLAPTDDLVFRPGDIVIVVGVQAELDQLIPWFTGQRPLTTMTLTQSA